MPIGYGLNRLPLSIARNWTTPSLPQVERHGCPDPFAQ
jgi:hypothetical protein